jgi:hypothetical protein
MARSQEGCDAGSRAAIPVGAPVRRSDPSAAIEVFGIEELAGQRMRTTLLNLEGATAEQ